MISSYLNEMHDVTCVKLYRSKSYLNPQKNRRNRSLSYYLKQQLKRSVTGGENRELKIETFSGRRQLQPDVTSSFVGYCACSCSPPCRGGPVGDVKLVCLALWRKREYLTFISIRFVAFSNQYFADYRS